MKITKNGVTLTELLAYISIVGIVVVLLTSTFMYTIRSYDIVNGQGAIYTEANFIMSNLITQANVFNPQYIQSCGDNCIELVIETEKKIEPDLGLLIEVPVNKKAKIRIDGNNIYIGDMKLNNTGYGVDINNSNISYSCYDPNKDNEICQKFILSLRLALVRVNKEGEIISSQPYIFENRFSF